MKNLIFYQSNFDDLLAEFQKFDEEDLFDIEDQGCTIVEEYNFFDFNSIYIKAFVYFIEYKSN